MQFFGGIFKGAKTMILSALCKNCQWERTINTEFNPEVTVKKLLEECKKHCNSLDHVVNVISRVEPDK